MTRAVMKETRTSGQGVKAFFAKMSRGLMLPIALLPIAGLFLGVGAGFENVIKQAMEGSSEEAIAQATFFFVIMKSIGDVVFGNLPTLFCLGIAVAYAHDSGVATFAALVGWIVFNATQSTMIWENTMNIINNDVAGLAKQSFNGIGDISGIILPTISEMGVDGVQQFDFANINDLYSGTIFYIPGNVDLTDKEIVPMVTKFLSGLENLMLQADLKDGEVYSIVSAVFDNTYSILWWGNVPSSVVGMNVGLTSMQTSVFGGITIGLFVAFLYNKFHDFQLPKVLGFFSGNKFVPIITFLTVPLWGFFFLMAWPAFGIALNAFGGLLGSMPYGIDSFIFGVIERSLVPFGLHHAFYSPLWYTSAGGELLDVSGKLLAAGNQNIWFKFQELGIDFSSLPGIGFVSSDWGVYEYINGDWMWVSGAPGLSEINGKASLTDYWAITNGDETYYMTEGTNPGSYMQGKFIIMIFGLPSAALAMIMACKKENRQVAMSVIGAAGLTSFLTGITEPLEFTFLFLAPYLYYGFHIWMAGIGFMLADILGSHVALTFSGGIFDFVLFGILPDATGFGVNSFWLVLIGLVYMPIYYCVFYFSITRLDIKTPGRTDDSEINMISKVEFNEAKEMKKVKKKKGQENRTGRVELLIKHLGGLDNFTSADACITRLRITVNDRKKVNDKGLTDMGAAGVVGKGKAIQIIFGWEADVFKNEINKKRNEV